MRGKLILLEGIDGAGKTTLVHKLRAFAESGLIDGLGGLNWRMKCNANVEM